MRDQNGFDLWADGYDRTVAVSDAADSYPFAGYGEILRRLCGRILEKPGARVLDIGFGTGALAARLYGHGCVIYGQDFSPRMIALAKEKMPEAHLYQGDFARGLAAPLLRRRYDFIVATYSLHHLTDAQKLPLIRRLARLLEEDGALLIGDIAFRTRAELERCRREAADDWDDDEAYFVADEWRQALPALSFTPVSRCAGILELAGKDLTPAGSE